MYISHHLRYPLAISASNNPLSCWQGFVSSDQRPFTLGLNSQLNPIPLIFHRQKNCHHRPIGMQANRFNSRIQQHFNIQMLTNRTQSLIQDFLVTGKTFLIFIDLGVMQCQAHLLRSPQHQTLVFFFKASWF